ncbi:hypothetical protein M3Y97_00804300 [Aphelenchoides bicaudatus]|nr:hypothetical protein M3Y97_00804300 [Aphelenchoides bicaudatus]
MTTLLSFLCNEPLISACNPRRNTQTSDNEYLLDSESWEAPIPSKSSVESLKSQCALKDHPNVYRQPTFQRLISLMNALNPLKKDPNEQAFQDSQRPKLSASQTVSFAANTPTGSCNPAMLTKEDYEIRHFAFVDINPGGKPLFICDAKHSDRSKWFAKKTAQSFDVALRRRRSLSCARMNRRAFSLNKMAELDASAKRAAYSRQRANRRPESSFIDAKTYNGRPLFYAFEEDPNMDTSDLVALEWNHPARGVFELSCFESTCPPRPPKFRTFNGSPSSRTYVNEIKAPPRPPKS